MDGISRRQMLANGVAAILAGGIVSTPVAGSEVARGPTVYVGARRQSTEGALLALDATNGAEQWSFNTEGAIESSPTVVDGTVYVGSNAGVYPHVYAVDAETGEEEWSTQVEDHVGLSSPTVVDGLVFIGCGEGNVYALDAADGTERWSVDTPRAVGGSPTVVDGTVYFNSGNSPYVDDPAHLYALDAACGSMQWSTEFESIRGGESSPTVADGMVYVGNLNDHLYAVDADTGDVEWSVDTGAGVRSSPTVVDGRVFVGSGGRTVDDGVGTRGLLVALDADDGTPLWEFEVPDGITVSSPTVVDGTVIVGGTSGSKDSVIAVDVVTGQQQWGYGEAGEASSVVSSPTVANGMVFVKDQNGTLYALSPGSGSVVWSTSVGGSPSSPTVVDDPGGGDSVDSRVLLGTLGHHHAAAGEGIDTDDDCPADESGSDDERGDDDPDEPRDRDPDDEPADGDSDDEPDDDASYEYSVDGDFEVPGFGVPAALAGLAGAGYLLRRQSRDDETEPEPEQ